MYGVSLFAPHGPGGISRPALLPDIPQIAERRADHIEAWLETRFGDAADRVFNNDGTLDLDALRTLFEEQRPGNTPSRPGHGRGLYLGPPISGRPFFDFRA